MLLLPTTSPTINIPMSFGALAFRVACLWNTYFLLSCVMGHVVTLVWESVRTKLTLPKWGLGSPPGLSKVQSSIAKVKTPCIEAFFISLEIYWSLDVQNGLAWPIWTSKTQVMAKRMVGSQTGNLIPNHGKSGIDPIPLRSGDVQHIVGKLSIRATTLV
jgi:hypothetical protein